MKKLDFSVIQEDSTWSFQSIRSVEQWTHGYHRYPAKFLPNVVKKLIEDEYVVKGAPIADPFAGCGTTLVEAKIHGYESYGVDVNPVAELITKVKTTPINSELLTNCFEFLKERIGAFSEEMFELEELYFNEKINYWFSQESKIRIAYLYQQITTIKDKDCRNFFLVALSHVLKNCSRWLQGSTKPQVDKKKTPVNPFIIFERHTRSMMRKNQVFFQGLRTSRNLTKRCSIKKGDARCTRWRAGSIGTIITSPPYVTSYEYADIHQLTGYWYEMFSDLKKFRKDFIGTSYSDSQTLVVSASKLGQEIVCQLADKSEKIARDVAKYFNDMSLVAKEMFRVLREGGTACVVIGNTSVRGVEIRSAEVFWELMKKAGFRGNERKDVIKRSIPHKLMPTIRNKNTGRFSKGSDPDSKEVYPNEYILILRK